MKLDDAILMEQGKKFSSIDWHKRDFELTMRYEDLKTMVTSAVIGTALGAWTIGGMNTRYFPEEYTTLNVISGALGVLALAVSYGAFKSYRARSHEIRTIEQTREFSNSYSASYQNSPSNT